MSHALGAVKLNCGNIYYFEYNGTVDLCLPRLYKTVEEVYEDWRQNIWPPHEGCEVSDNAIMATTYGGGFGWTVKVCKKHMMIVGNRSSETIDHLQEGYYDGLPDWFPNKESYEL